MNTYPIVYREHNAAVFTLKNLGGDPEAICKKVDASYINEDDWRTGRWGAISEEMASDEAYSLIQGDILHRWLASIPRPVMVTMITALMRLSYGAIEYIPGEILSARAAVCAWNKDHPNEEPIQVIGEGEWPC